MFINKQDLLAQRSTVPFSSFVHICIKSWTKPTIQVSFRCTLQLRVNVKIEAKTGNQSVIQKTLIHCVSDI